MRKIAEKTFLDMLLWRGRKNLHLELFSVAFVVVVVAVYRFVSDFAIFVLFAFGIRFFGRSVEISAPRPNQGQEVI